MQKATILFAIDDKTSCSFPLNMIRHLYNHTMRA